MSPLLQHRLRRTVRRDRTVSAAASFFIHAALFFLGGALFVHGAEFGVQNGGGVEVDLIAAPMAAVPEPVVQTPVLAPVDKDDILEASDAVKPPALPEPPKISGDSSSPIPGKDATTLHALAGAVTEARPKYLRNPAPVYPAEARRQGEEGLVSLTADVDPSGRAVDVSLKKSSGYPLLDESALTTVKRWKFEPARLGTLKVASQVEVPIRFQLKENR